MNLRSHCDFYILVGRNYLVCHATCGHMRGDGGLPKIVQWNLSWETTAMRDGLSWQTTYFWQKGLHFNITEPVTTDHLPWQTTFLWQTGWSFKTGFSVLWTCWKQSLQDASPVHCLQLLWRSKDALTYAYWMICLVYGFNVMRKLHTCAKELQVLRSTFKTESV